jgi:hypothetical protein
MINATQPGTAPSNLKNGFASDIHSEFHTPIDWLPSLNNTLVVLILAGDIGNSQKDGIIPSHETDIYLLYQWARNVPSVMNRTEYCSGYFPESICAFDFSRR